MIVIKFISELTKSDWIHVYFYKLLHEKSFWLIRLTYPFVLMLGLSYLTKHFIIFSLIIFAIYVVFDIIYYLNKYLKKVAKDFKDIKVYYEITEDFIRGDTNNSRFEIRIKEIKKVVETQRLFLISLDKSPELVFSKKRISNSDLESIERTFFEKGTIYKKQ